MLHVARLLIAVLVLTACPTPGATAAENAAKPRARVLAVLPPDDAPLGVAFITDGEYVRGALIGGLLMAAINQATANARNEPLAVALDQSVSGYERNPPLASSLRQAFGENGRGDAFDIVTTTDRARYFSEQGKDHLTNAAAEEHFDFVLVLDQRFAGLWMAARGYTRTDDLTPAISLRYRVYSVHSPGLLQKGEGTAYGLEKRFYKEAVRDRAFFTTLWPNVTLSMARYIVGDLNRTDKLHAMAASAGRGDDVPAVAAVLEKYAKRFRFDLEPVKGWRETKLATPYARVLEPQGEERNVYGMRFDVDLLVPEFGQDFDSLEDYLVVFQRRKVEIQPDCGPLQRYDDVTAPGFESYSIECGSGRNVVLFRHLSPQMVEVVQFVFVKDFDTLYPANRARMQRMLGDGRVTLR